MFYGRGYNSVVHCFDRFGFMPGGGWMLLFFVILVAVSAIVVLLIVRNRNVRYTKFSNDKAQNELKMRYARGEISEEEYLRSRNILNQ